MEDDKPIVVLGPLSGPDGNAFVIMAACRDALREAGRKDEWPAIRDDMTSSNYEHLLDVVDQHFMVMGTRYAMDPDWRTT